MKMFKTAFKQDLQKVCNICRKNKWLTKFQNSNSVTSNAVFYSNKDMNEDNQHPNNAHSIETINESI